MRVLLADVSVVPEPISSTLFLIGGATLVYISYKKGSKE